jgi:hypothetical protein
MGRKQRNGPKTPDGANVCQTGLVASHVRGPGFESSHLHQLKTRGKSDAVDATYRDEGRRLTRTERNQTVTAHFDRQGYGPDVLRPVDLAGLPPIKFAVVNADVVHCAGI